MSMPIDPPMHGYRGVGTPPPVLVRPAGIAVAISREAGARGGSIATAVGKKLGWQVFTQEMLDFMARADETRHELERELTPHAKLWALSAFDQLVAARGFPANSDTAVVARLILFLAARGQVVLVGRGAGFLLPAPTTVHVRVIAPEPQRIAYLSQWLRLTEVEAEQEMRSRDQRRAHFLGTISDRDITDNTAYDLVLNSSRLGIDLAAELIAVAVAGKRPLDDS